MDHANIAASILGAYYGFGLVHTWPPVKSAWATWDGKDSVPKPAHKLLILLTHMTISAVWLPILISTEYKRFKLAMLRRRAVKALHEAMWLQEFKSTEAFDKLFNRE